MTLKDLMIADARHLCGSWLFLCDHHNLAIGRGHET